MDTMTPEKAYDLFADIAKREYKYLSASEINALKNYADEYYAGTMVFSGYEFGYDTKLGLVWLEYEPEEAKDDD